MAKQKNLEISNNVIKFDHESYQIRNIVRLSKFSEKVSYLGYAVILTVIISGTLFISQQADNEGAMLIGFGIVFLILLNMIISRSKFLLKIETNSGCGTLLYARKEQIIDDLIDLISLVMDSENSSVHYNIDMSDYSVNETVMGDKFSNIKDAVIATRNAVAKGGVKWVTK